MEMKILWQCINKLGSKKVLVAGAVDGVSHGSHAMGNDTKCVVAINNIFLEGDASEWIQQSSDLKGYFIGDFEGVFHLGECDTNTGRAFECCLRSMILGEVSLISLTIKADQNLSVANDRSTVGTICCQVIMKDILKNNLFFELGSSEKYEIAMSHRSRGVELFKSDRYIDAFLRFSKGLKYVISIGYDDSNSACTTKNEMKSLRTVLYNNLASCQLKLNNFGHTSALCDKVLLLEPDNVKALYRRAVANIALRNYDEARNDLTAVLRLEPQNTAAGNKLKEVNSIEINVDADYTNVVKKMFKHEIK